MKAGIFCNRAASKNVLCVQSEKILEGPITPQSGRGGGKKRFTYVSQFFEYLMPESIYVLL